jgi:hypothetical protein
VREARANRGKDSEEKIDGNDVENARETDTGFPEGEN